MAEIIQSQRYTRGRHPNSLKNLKPYPKGVTGHPGQKPKIYSITAAVKELLDTVPPDETKGRTWIQILALAILTQSLKNPTFFKELIERLEGKVALPIEGGDKPIILSLIDELHKKVKEAK